MNTKANSKDLKLSKLRQKVKKLVVMYHREKGLLVDKKVIDERTCELMSAVMNGMSDINLIELRPKLSALKHSQYQAQRVQEKESAGMADNSCQKQAQIA